MAVASQSFGSRQLDSQALVLDKFLLPPLVLSEHIDQTQAPGILGPASLPCLRNAQLHRVERDTEVQTQQSIPFA